ncbi:MAG: metal ABC transporter permease [Pseudobutyrivibrio sp.]|mgnify:FL=1|nr:metal ABC transporter permease [Pseudobutyrivibrio sp.]
MSSVITQLFDFDFMRRAFIAILIITPLFGMVGTMIVQKKMAYFSDALGHSALTGIAIGVIFGISNTSISMVIFAIFFALLLNQISRKGMSSKDTLISVFSCSATAIGLAILSRGGSFANYSALLVGDILSITPREIISLVALFVVMLVYWLWAVNRLTAISIHPTLAKSRSISVHAMEDIFAVLMALLVMLSIKWVGILLINALLILPAASSRNISENMREYAGYSVLFSVFSGLVGLIVSYFTDMATGPMIVIVASAIYFCTYIYGKK